MKKHTLGRWEEVVGVLKYVNQLKGNLLQLTFGNVTVIVVNEGEMRSELAKMVGRVVGVLRADDGYRVRLMARQQRGDLTI